MSNNNRIQVRFGVKRNSFFFPNAGVFKFYVSQKIYSVGLQIKPLADQFFAEIPGYEFVFEKVS
jgi:hypothetical protein